MTYCTSLSYRAGFSLVLFGSLLLTLCLNSLQRDALILISTTRCSCPATRCVCSFRFTSPPERITTDALCFATVVSQISLYLHRRHPNVSALSRHLVTFSPRFKSPPGRISTASPFELMFPPIQVSTRTHPSSSGCYLSSILSGCHQVSPSSNLPTVLSGGNQTTDFRLSV